MKLNADEALLAGTAGDWVLNRRVLEMFDLGAGYGRGNRAERILKRLSDEASVINGLSVHNSYIKRWVGTIQAQSIADHAQLLTTGRHWNGKHGTVKEKRFAMTELARGKIDPDLARRIWRELENRPKVDRMIEFQTEQWTDVYARDRFRSSLRGATDAIINTPKIGDRPLFMSRELGRFIFQYKSFAFASTMQTVIPFMQSPSYNWMNGAFIATGFGAISLYLKSVAGGWNTPGVDTETGLMWWIRNSIDRAGYHGILGDMNNYMGFLTRGQLSAGNLLPGGPDSGFVHTNRNILTELAGPSGSTLVDVAKIAMGMSDAILFGEQPPTRAYNAFRRTLPFNNHFLLNRTVFQPAIEHVERNMRRGFADELRSNRGIPR
jgi:hypothetical protein